MKKIIFRCDAGKIKELGTGHLIRSLSLAKMLIKSRNIKKKDILFLIKTKKKYSISKKIIQRENFSYKSIDNSIRDFTNKEAKIILENNFDILIIDRLGKINLNFIKLIRKNKKKIICFDNFSKNRFLCDLSINPLIFESEYKKTNHFSGYEYNILPSHLVKKKIKRISKVKTIFLSFGGYDIKNLMKVTKRLFNENYRFNLVSINNKNSFDKKTNFYKKMERSDLVISSGGLTMFDALNFYKPVLAIPQYNHQFNNIKTLSKKGLVKLVRKKDLPNIFNIISKMNKEYLQKNFKKILVFNKRQKLKFVLIKIKFVIDTKFNK